MASVMFHAAARLNSKVEIVPNPRIGEDKRWLNEVQNGQLRGDYCMYIYLNKIKYIKIIFK